MSVLKTFVGFRGVAMLAGIEGFHFVLIASNPAELEAIYTKLLPDSPVFNPAMCQKSVMIQSELLTKSKKS
jgi:hypothetical protein